MAKWLAVNQVCATPTPAVDGVRLQDIFLLKAWFRQWPTTAFDSILGLALLHFGSGRPQT